MPVFAPRTSMKSFILPALFSALFLAALVRAVPVEHDLSPTSSSPVVANGFFRWSRETAAVSSAHTTFEPVDSPLDGGGIFMWRRDTTLSVAPTQTAAPSSAPVVAPDIFRWADKGQ